MKVETRLIIGSTAFVLLFGIISSAVISGSSSTLSESFNGSWACSADTTVCPDGKIVQRVPPYCQFALCVEQ